MPRFVLLRHECPPDVPKPSHWDFMLEQAGVLWTWELRELPENWQRLLGHCNAGNAYHDPGEVRAIRLADHRLAYLDYEGPVSGNRGAVSRCDSGDFELLEQREGFLRVRLKGRKIRGCGQLTSPHGEVNWLLLAEEA